MHKSLQYYSEILHIYTLNYDVNGVGMYINAFVQR